MLIYLATPYSDPDPEVRRHRFQQVTIAAGKLMSAGHHVFSPITHCHPIALVADLPTDWAYWESYCTKTLSACQILTILTLPGWEESKGVSAELKLATQNNLPINYLTP